MNKCKICSRNFNDSDLLKTIQREFFCKQCFTRQFCAGTDKKETQAENKCEANAAPTPRHMFTAADISAAMRKKSEERREIQLLNKPLECPYANCKSCISVLDFLDHFQREHKTVPVIPTQLDSRIHLSFNLSDLRYGIKHVFCLLQVSPPAPQLTPSLPAKQPTTQTMVVLASRLMAAQLGEGNRDYVPDDEERATSLRNTDRVVIWVASNLSSNNRYTAAVSSISEDPLRFKYCGPVLQLANKPNQLCLDGRCLILTRFHLSALTENGGKPMDLDVVVHSAD